jgi:hypothetical protein
MSERPKESPWVNTNLFNANSSKIPYEELRKYAGQVIAWTLDGTRILACGADEKEVEERLREMDIDPSQVVFDNVPECDTIL